MQFLTPIKEVFNSLSIPASSLPPTFIALGGPFRPGISPSLVATRIITRQSEAGAPCGQNEDGSANIAEAMERIRVEEIVNAIKKESNIQVAIPPGNIQIEGPTGVVGVNTKFVTGYGIIQ